MRARMALGVAGIACELREVLLRDKPAEMLALSKKAQCRFCICPMVG